MAGRAGRWPWPSVAVLLFAGALWVSGSFSDEAR